LIRIPSLETRIAEREAIRPAEFKGYITGLRRLWFEVLEKPHTIVELGTYLGNSAFAWLSCGTQLITVDTEQSDLALAPLRQDLKDFGWSCQLIQKDSIEFAGNFEGTVDMVYIDTTHEYVQTRREVEEWILNIRPGGWLVLDDAVSYPEVLRAFSYCVEVSCKNQFDWFTVYTRPPYTPPSHGLLVAKLV
jgi:predicted O-methyltransferase YrrM